MKQPKGMSCSLVLNLDRRPPVPRMALGPVLYELPPSVLDQGRNRCWRYKSYCSCKHGCEAAHSAQLGLRHGGRLDIDRLLGLLDGVRGDLLLKDVLDGRVLGDGAGVKEHCAAAGTLEERTAMWRWGVSISCTGGHNGTPRVWKGHTAWGGDTSSYVSKCNHDVHASHSERPRLYSAAHPMQDPCGQCAPPPCRH